ncbi:MAG: hypothetical protein ACOC44_04130 [Promethearchaeia archaeon]
MAVQCSSCGDRFSLGRKIYHKCEKEKKFYGALFYERVEHEWNSNEPLLKKEKVP